MRNINIGARVLVEIAENCTMEGEVVNINFYHEPSLWYAVDVGLDDYVFVGRDKLEEIKVD